MCSVSSANYVPLLKKQIQKATKTRILITHRILHRSLTLALQLEVKTTAQLQP